MKNVLILGANGQIAKLVTQRLVQETENQLTLYLRNSSRLREMESDRVSVVEGDVNDFLKLSKEMKDKDIVYANLGGRFEPMAKNIVKAMDQNKISRLIYVTGLGLYHEVPGEFGQWVEESIGSEVMDDTRRAAEVIENSDVNYTIVRAAYMDNDPEVDYELTEKGEPYKGTIISRASIADLIVKIIKDDEEHSYSSLGISKPGTEGNRPMF